MTAAIDNLLLESFDLNPLQNSYYLDPTEIFNEGTDEWHEIYSEATTGTTKSNIFQKLWNFIKKALRWLAKKAMSIYKFIKSLFTGKRNLKTADQIMEEISSSGSFSYSSDDITTSELNKSSSISLSSLDREIENEANKAKEIISIPKNPRSEMDLPDIQLINKQFILSFDTMKKFIVIDIKGIRDHIWSDKNAGKIKGQDVAGAALKFHKVLVMLDYPDVLDKFKNVIDQIGTYDYEKINTAMREYEKLYEKYNVTYNRSDDTKHRYTLDQFMEFNKKINEMANAFDTFNDPNNDTVYDSKLIKLLNEISADLSVFQMAMNAITGALSNAFIVDRKYKNSINNIELLSEFVENSIKSGIPPKYIMYNMYIMSTSEIKGDGKKGNEDAPIAGQFRAILFPGNKSVYKVALSGIGIKSNKSECDISDIFKKNNGDHLISVTTGHTKNYAIISAEELDTKTTFNAFQLVDLKDKLDEFCIEHEIPLSISRDIHEKNAGFKNGKLAALDYGWVDRKI